MPSVKRFRLNEVHSILDVLESDPDFLQANLYVLPPADPNCSDEDSGGEDEVTPDNLTRRQLEAEGEATVWKGDQRIRLGSPDDDDNGEHEPGLSTLQQNYCSMSPASSSASPSASGTVTPASASTIQQVDSTPNTNDLTNVPEHSTPLTARPRSASSSRRRTAKAPSASRTTTSLARESIQPSELFQEADNSKASVEPLPKVAKKVKVEKPVRKWLKSDMPENCRPPDIVVNNHYASTDMTPTALFEQFFDDELMQLLTENSNKYAMQKGRHGFQTSPFELRLFLAILFNSGYAPLPRRRLYWEPSADVQNTAVSCAMTRNRFEELMTNIHVSDNNNLPQNDRMAKVRPLFTALNSKFVNYFPRQQHLSVDESMVPYYGRHSSKQFIRGKPIRFGYKVWSINSSLGYCIQLDPYQGSGTTMAELGLGGSVVVQLASSLPSDSYVLYFDNFFTSLRLLQHLSSCGMKATGTVRANRIEDCPIMPVDRMKKVPRGTSDHRIDSGSNILVARWHDNSIVTLASNCHGMEPAGTAQRWSSAEKRRIDITQPYLIGQYNKYMGGVDRMDQNIGTYRISIRSRKWWWPLFAYLLDVTMQNAWIIYRQTEGAKHRPLDQLEFRRDICNVYYKRYTTDRPTVGRRPVGRPKHVDVRSPVEIRTDRTDHFIESIPTQRRCAVCGLKVKKQCSKCNVGLHLDACFAAFHRL